jgi:hypothetical protein
VKANGIQPETRIPATETRNEMRPITRVLFRKGRIAIVAIQAAQNTTTTSSAGPTTNRESPAEIQQSSGTPIKATFNRVDREGGAI